MVASCLLVVGLALPQAAPPAPLHLLYVGEAKQPDRAKDFERFLTERFGTVEVATDRPVAPEQIAAADVVVLDWHQGGGELGADCPLGARETWTKPLVLLGSAGLHVACAWEVLGGYG